MKKIILFVAFVSCSFAIASGQAPTVKETFGGVGAQISVLEDMSAILTFDCARGDVAAGRWPTNQSRINAVGTYTQQTGVRPPAGFIPRSEKAIYAATIDTSSGKMTLSVKVGKKRAVSYHLIKGQQSDLKRCL